MESRTRSRVPERFRPRPRFFELGPDQAPADLAQALVRLRARRSPVLLDSAGGVPREVSLLAFDPLPAPAPASLVELRALLERYDPRPGDPLPAGGRAAPDGLPQAFTGGFVGALSYDLGVEGEPLDLPRDDWDLPLVAGGLYCDYLVRNERSGRTWLCLGEDPGDDRPSLRARRDELLAQLAAPAPEPGAPRWIEPLSRRVPPAEHARRIEAARDWIARGEFYQANLAHPFEGRVEADPLDLYLALRDAAPTPYAGFLRQDAPGGEAEFALLSCSPELLLAVDPAAPPSASVARTRPIKGTVRRPEQPEADPEGDRRAAEVLLASAKDRAELAMIVDLERNDLGTVARRGGVRVEQFPALESHPAVHHLVADVIASLRPGVGCLDALAALFPGGSITGAPKLRSMEAIAELEGEGRGFAFGSLGCADRRGSARFNLLIRTLVWRSRPGAGAHAPLGELRLRVGGGITWGSDAAAEDDETLAKAAALLDGLGRADTE